MTKETPCDYGECPFGEGGGMYFCRDNCGLGVDEDSYPEEDYEPDDSDIECGFDLTAVAILMIVNHQY